MSIDFLNRLIKIATDSRITNKLSKCDEIIISLAAMIAMGTKIGLTKMADATLGISYYQLAHAS